MTITEQADFTLNHRSFKQALENYKNGHIDDLRYILIILQREAANKTKESQIRCYKNWCRLNIADIKHELQINPLPENMDCRLPLVKPIAPIETKTMRMRLMITGEHSSFDEVA